MRRSSQARRLAVGAAATLIIAAGLGAPAAGSSRASVTRPGGGSSSGSSGSGSSGSSSRSTISSDARGRAPSTRPGGSTSGGRTVISDDRRPLGGFRGHHHGFHGHHRHHSLFLGYYYPWSTYWGWTWGHPWGYYPPYGYGYGYGYGYYPRAGAYAATPGYGMGALDLNVRPKDAEVYVDGQYVGLARQYDGFPGYLWLEKGSYELAFYRPGMETVVRQFEIFTGLVLDVAIEMVPGNAVLPAAPAGRPAPSAPLPPEQGVYGGPEQGAYRPPERGAYRPPERAAPAEPAAAAAQVRLEIAPPEASVYLDGQFVGTASELARLHQGLLTTAGAHVLEVVAPGMVPETVHFELRPGEESTIQVYLEPSYDA